MDEQTIDWIRNIVDELQNHWSYDFTSKQHKSLDILIGMFNATETFEEAFKDY